MRQLTNQIVQFDQKRNARFKIQGLRSQIDLCGNSLKLNEDIGRLKLDSPRK